MKPLYQDVDVSTLRSMREEQGMSNAEIANALGTTRETVWKYIGPGPRKPYTRRAETVKTTTIRKSVKELFPTISTEVTLTGKKFTYRVHPDKPDVTIGPCSLFDISSMVFNADDFDALIEELQYIRRIYMR